MHSDFGELRMEFIKVPRWGEKLVGSFAAWLDAERGARVLPRSINGGIL